MKPNRLAQLLRDCDRWSSLLNHQRNAIIAAQEQYDLMVEKNGKAHEALCAYYKKYGRWSCQLAGETALENGTYEEALAAGQETLKNRDKGFGWSTMEAPGTVYFCIVSNVDENTHTQYMGEIAVTLTCVNEEEMNRAALEQNEL